MNEKNRYISETDWEAPTEADVQDYLTGNLLEERPTEKHN